ncbi:MAG TPA: YfiR family protein [Candidatus Dormibacteraeota bacterium]|nr:YfiR family protein [Candidatus Dormibacteraeota bacterium]
MRWSTPSADWLSIICRRAVVVALVASILSGTRVLAQQNGPSEYQLKAAFLFNFAKFVDWPPGSFAGPKSPFVICILGPDPFGQTIDDTLRGQTMDSRPVTVLRVQDPPQLRRCQVAFVGATEAGHLPAIVQALRGANVLLVGETPGFAAAGGAIQFEMRDRHIRFSINPAAAERAGLRVSSKLLSLATIVRDGDGSGKG